MLYTFSYDVESRKNSGTAYPVGTWTEAIHQYMRERAAGMIMITLSAIATGTECSGCRNGCPACFMK